MTDDDDNAAEEPSFVTGEADANAVEGGEFHLSGGVVDIVAALALIGISIYVIYETRVYPPSIIEGAPGPAYFPRLLAFSLLGLSALLLVGGVKKRKVVSISFQRAALGKIVSVALLIVAFLGLAGRADFFVLIFLLLVAVIIIGGERRLAAIFLVPASFVVFMYVVFYRLFGVMFPTNIF